MENLQVLSLKVNIFDSDFYSNEFKKSFQFFIDFTKLENSPFLLKLEIKTQHLFFLNNRSIFKNISSFALKKINLLKPKNTMFGCKAETVSDYFMGVLMPYSSKYGIDLTFIPVREMRLKNLYDNSHGFFMLTHENGGKTLIIKQEKWISIES